MAVFVEQPLALPRSAKKNPMLAQNHAQNCMFFVGYNTLGLIVMFP